MGKYTVKWGDTLSQIAADNGVTVADLQKWNNIPDANRIQAGQVIKLSSDSPAGAGTEATGSSGSGEKSDNEFTYSPFTTSDETNAALGNLNALTTPDTLDPSYWATVQAAQDKINNREKFSYDLNGDALYQQYKDKYIQQGKMAMQDTMGQAAALTGGYGNSYASTAGNQAYQAHLENLNDVVPELWQMAYDRYNQEGQDLLNQYAMAKDNYATKYGEWSDQMAQYNTDRSYLQAVYDSLYGRDYTMWNDGRTFAYGQHRDAITDEQWKAAMDYTSGRDTVADQQWEREYRAKYGNNAVEYDDGTDNTGGNDNTGGDDDNKDKYYSNGGYGEDMVKKAQEFVGVTADGKWGKNSTAAAKAKGYNSIADVVKAMQGPQVDPNSKNITGFKSRVHSSSAHDAIARQMYGPYTAYLAVEIYNDKSLSDQEKTYLIQYYGITANDLQYAKDKGHKFD
jgi:hypothetical protein